MIGSNPGTWSGGLPKGNPVLFAQAIRHEKVRSTNIQSNDRLTSLDELETVGNDTLVAPEEETTVMGRLS